MKKETIIQEMREWARNPPPADAETCARVLLILRRSRRDWLTVGGISDACRQRPDLAGDKLTIPQVESAILRLFRAGYLVHREEEERAFLFRPAQDAPPVPGVAYIPPDDWQELRANQCATPGGQAVIALLHPEKK